jgi:hypothetical protein
MKGSWRLSAGVLALVLFGLVVGCLVTEPVLMPPTLLHDEVSVPFVETVLSVEEWERFCGVRYDFGPGERGQHHCSIQVIADCPPDCGTFKMLREDRLLRRVP